MEKLNDKKRRLYLLHTTDSVVEYLEKLFSSYVLLTHRVDKNFLPLLRSGDFKWARRSIEKDIEDIRKIKDPEEQILITCTSVGYIDTNFRDKNVIRIVDASIDYIKSTDWSIGIVFTNQPVFEEIRSILASNWILEERLIPCFIPDAFLSITSGDADNHDLLVVSALKRNEWWVDNYFLSQVSVCSANSRSLNFQEVKTPIISMTDNTLEKFFKR